MRQNKALKNLMAFLAACFAFVAALALFGTAYAAWTVSGGTTSKGSLTMNGAVTDDWIYTVKLYASEEAVQNGEKVLWERDYAANLQTPFSYSDTDENGVTFEKAAVDRAQAIFDNPPTGLIAVRVYEYDGQSNETSATSWVTNPGSTEGRYPLVLSNGSKHYLAITSAYAVPVSRNIVLFVATIV